MARSRNRRRRSGSPASRRGGGTSRWVLVLTGLVAGALALAGAIYIRDKLRSPPVPAAASGARPAPKPQPKAPSAPPEKRFEFYEMLPNSEVIVPEEGRDVRPGKTPVPLDTPGVYVLQAGSYGEFADADRVKAKLALLGIRSQIQEITVDERRYHRVRIGPIEDLAELNRNRGQLRKAGIDFLVIRVGE
ncbi:MAG: SPOR domain-containing protein [Gammaproteobacteria bacterium]|nr:MAG: SPOR domain-containing protein [Gammaproteobacteria bacterium]